MAPKMTNAAIPAWFAPYVEIRNDAYAILASLLRCAPSGELLDTLANLSWSGPIPEAVDEALTALVQAARTYSLDTLQSEYDRLFVGLGSGEVVPYASWYKDKTTHSAPLATVRSDLALLGIVRQAGNSEPEDHAATLCECMVLINDKHRDSSSVTPEGFFRQHIGSWMRAFFDDLQRAESAGFYATVGAFGRRFVESEMDYFAWGGLK